ncbi:MAG: guanylate kinase [Pyrinomonadaceae bacterium]|jgi:guanylate kinase|nr:guanylate kinase [Pyrinomonadaceae bacterium]
MSSEQKEFERLDTVAPEESTRGILFVVSSPSGGGKGTLIQQVLKQAQNLRYSVSYTTRAPRNGEVEGREYFFVRPEKFEAMVAAGEFLEWAHVHGKLYGTSRHQVSREVFEGRDIILEVDVQGAASVRELVTDSVSVFILPPSVEILRQRLIARGTDSSGELELRLRHAPAELKHYKEFDYVIINDEVEKAAGHLSSIIEAERARRARQEPQIKRVVESFSLD